MTRTTEIVIDTLIEAGIDHVFGMPGGASIFLYDSLAGRKDRIRTILARHEGGAACMADMYGRLTRKPGVMIAQGAWAGSSGGFGVMEAFLAGSPVLVLADVSDYAGLIQFAPYQSTGGEYGSVDLPSIMRSMTKFTAFANTPDEFVHGTRLAIKHATTGRPGPTCVLFRWNTALSHVEPEKIIPRLHPLGGNVRVSSPCISQEDARKVADLLLQAREPVMILGRGVHASGAYGEVRELAECLGIAVATSYMGKSALEETHDLAVGTMGQIGQEVANRKIKDADLILAVGTCLGPENTKMLSPDFIRPEQQKIVQIDIEPLNVGWTFPVTLGIASDARLAMRAILEVLREKSPRIDVQGRIRDLKSLKETGRFFASDASNSDASPIAPQRIVQALNRTVGRDDLVVLDAGNNRMFAAKLFQSRRAGQVIAPGGAAGVGWGVPAALAAQLVQAERRVLCLCGDGGMMMMLYALEMAREYELPVTYVVMNNSCLANVMDFQAPGRRIATEYGQTDFAAIARAMGCLGRKVEKPSDLEPVLEEALVSRLPAVVDVSTSQEPHFVLMS